MKTYTTGFTLIELLIAVVIVSILSAIAIPAYQNYVASGKRAQAKSTMLNLSQMEERYYSNNYTYYAASAVPPAPEPLGWSNYSGPSMSARTYNISVAIFPVPPANAASFVITAVPSNNFVDAKCGTLTLDNMGAKTSSTSASGCW
jgi:type IV pilus assembly protein PilE